MSDIIQINNYKNLEDSIVSNPETIYVDIIINNTVDTIDTIDTIDTDFVVTKKYGTINIIDNYINNIDITYNSQFFECYNEENCVNNAVGAVSYDSNNNKITSSYVFEKDPLFLETSDPDPFINQDNYDNYNCSDKNKHHKLMGNLGIVTFSAMIMLGSAYITKYF
jgi:hypothetical protein